MKLKVVQAGDSAAEDLSPFEGMPIHTLAVNGCRVKDLTPVTKMQELRFLRSDGCAISSLAPLRESAVQELYFTPDRARGDLDLVNSMGQLQLINKTRPSEFRCKHGLAD